MRGGVLAALAAGVGVIAFTMPASAFNSSTDPDTYYNDQIASVNVQRVFLGEQGKAYESVDGFTKRMPDDEFDDQILQQVNDYRTEHGLSEARVHEPLRTQSAMWANRMADSGDGRLYDRWYTYDARVVCQQLDDIFTVSSFTQGSAQLVFENWLGDPAVKNGMLLADPVYLGSATVNDGTTRWTTMRIARGSCPGEPNDVSEGEPNLPAPELITTQGGNDVAVQINRQGASQLQYEVQWFNGSYWSLGRTAFAEPGTRTMVSDLLPGTYRVVVPQQAGYGTAISENITIS